MAIAQRFTESHNDLKGYITTALTGASQFTNRIYRNTGIAHPHMANTDVLAFVTQIYHNKKMGSNADSFHIHYIPIGSADGTIVFDYSWGWYNVNDTIPDTLPNTGSYTLTLATTDQYKYKISSILTNIAPPANENYGSFLFFRIARNGGTWSPIGVNANEICILDADLHVIVDRAGSLYEFSDTI
jgi:hypothetical protein